MTQHRDLSYGERLPESWLDKIQELLGTYASPNMAITLANTTTVQIVAGTVNNQVGLAIQGRWRYITSTAQASHPGGSAGEYDVYACASDNSFTPGSPETDNTVYSFTLQVKASGQNPSTALYRKIATCTWSGTAITAITPLVAAPIASIGAQSVTTEMLQDDAVTQAKLAPNAVGATELADNAVDANALQTDAVTNAKMANLSVGTAELIDDSVTQPKIGPGAVGATELASGAVTQVKIAASSVGSTEIQDGSVGLSELQDGAVTDAKVAAANKDGAAGTASMRTLGTGAAQAASGNDSRLTNARTPTAHASSHVGNGATDALDLPVTNSQSGTTYTLVLADRSKIIEFTAGSAVAVTVPANSSVAFPIGTSITLFQIGAGQVTVVAAGGVTIQANPGMKLLGQYAVATLVKRGSDTWILFGTITT